MKRSKKNNAIKPTRSAGVLLHITSLPSAFGIGDIGPAAKRFADFLHNGKQRYWQLLPLSPTDRSQAYSPYSASSSTAGSTLLISPEGLVDDGFLTQDDIKSAEIRNTTKVDYGYAEKVKKKLLQRAYANFQKQSHHFLHQDFESFKDREQHWLHDFALFEVLKKKNGKKPWFHWADEERKRKKTTLSKIETTFLADIEAIKWYQFIFDRQWRSLKAYCNERNVLLFGDLPFYVGTDSADVWANRDVFAINPDGGITGVAGVPPDYFNSDGQLWGMPVFRWDVLQGNEYQWWVERLRKNMQLFDVVRLDHFRAFADYWEVPANETTARNGTWKPGPGSDFFKVMRDKLGALPFIAEDLGDINEGVHKLREEFDFPGMKILHFAFSGDYPRSAYIPHNFTRNFIVYTGTHDNNTTKGWYRKDISKHERKNLDDYIGKRIHADNVSDELIKLAYSSVARIAIIPMQDLLSLGESARMNTPASIKNNWLWRMKSNDITHALEQRMRSLVEMFNRY